MKKGNGPKIADILQITDKFRIILAKIEYYSKFLRIFSLHSGTLDKTRVFGLPKTHHYWDLKVLSSIKYTTITVILHYLFIQHNSYKLFNYDWNKRRDYICRYHFPPILPVGYLTMLWFRVNQTFKQIYFPYIDQKTSKALYHSFDLPIPYIWGDWRGVYFQIICPSVQHWHPLLVRPSDPVGGRITSPAPSSFYDNS